MDARLEPYRVVVSFLGEALGPDYEVVLHDLTSEDGTIVAIVNNTHQRTHRGCAPFQHGAALHSGADV